MRFYLYQPTSVSALSQNLGLVPLTCSMRQVSLLFSLIFLGSTDQVDRTSCPEQPEYQGNISSHHNFLSFSHRDYRETDMDHGGVRGGQDNIS